ncbi:MAG: hypothetical protein Q9210_001353 [Variospora velana]
MPHSAGQPACCQLTDWDEENAYGHRPPTCRTDQRNEEDATFSSIDLNGLQPQCEGPKLPPFPNRKATLKVIRRLSDPEHNGEAHVFEVTIARKAYALKIFKFYNEEADVEAFSKPELEVIGSDTLRAHSDPFYNECRAYGRLMEWDLNGRIAVRAHGYTTVTAENVHQLGAIFRIEDLIQDAEEHKINPNLPPYRCMFRAIVKDIIKDDVPLTHKRIKKMRRDLLQMREQGIYPLDIKRSNYRDGLLVDFSSAKTKPHFFLDMCAESRSERIVNEDLYAFDDMIKEANIKTWVKANLEEYKEKLRPRDLNRKKYPK